MNRGSGRLGAAIVVAVCGAALMPAGATASYAAGEQCREHQAIVGGDEDAVAARLPKRYTPVRDAATGKPLVVVRGLRCDRLTLNGRTAAATNASYGIVVETPDGRGCGSGIPAAGTAKGDDPPFCNWYTLAWMSDDQRVVDFLRDGTPGMPARLEPGLRFAPDGDRFHLETPAFTMDDTSSERPGELSVRGGYWFDTPQGTVELALSTDDLTAGSATGTIHAPAGSEVAALLGATERPYDEGYATLGAVRAAHGSYRKLLTGPARPGEALDTFEGSCDVQGVSHFTPPATNADQQLRYDYRGTGTCTGTLNGRRVSDLPVNAHQTGPAYGGCMRARTLAPGDGGLTFADGTALPFTVDFNGALTETFVTLFGDRSGTAGGQGTFFNDRTAPDITLQCGGDGAADAALDISFETDSPLVASRPAGAATQSGTAPRTAVGPLGALRLAVTPRAARAGRRTAFAFRVTTADGLAVPRALVRFANRHVRADRAGRVRIATTLHGRGIRTARATRSGFRHVQARISVRAK